MIKRGLILLVSFVCFFVLLVSAVSAAQPLTDVASNAVNSIIDLVKPFVGLLLNETNTAASNDIFMGKILIVILLISIFYVVLGKAMSSFFEGRKGILRTVSVILALLGVRFLTAEMIQTIIIPNSVLAVAVSAGLPFVLFFMIVKEIKNKYTRRACWVFFAVVFLAIYSLRADSLGSISYIYPLTALLALLMLAFDGTLQRWFAGERVGRALRIFDDQEYYRRKEENKKFYELYRAAVKAGNKEDAEGFMRKIRANEDQMTQLESVRADKSTKVGVNSWDTQLMK